eukprot:3548915-Amphidinium_carterae.1
MKNDTSPKKLGASSSLARAGQRRKQTALNSLQAPVTLLVAACFVCHGGKSDKWKHQRIGTRPK